MDQQRRPVRFLHSIKSGGSVAFFVYFIGFLVVIPLAVYQFYLLSNDMIYGGGSSEKLLISPRYDILRIPQTSLALERNAVGRLAADLAQIYFPSQDFSKLVNGYYVETTSDPWRRPSRYAPFVHFVCAITICRLPYGYAGFVHGSIQIVLFLAAIGFAFRQLQITKYIAPSYIFLGACLFLTPTGLSWFERGQFSLYIALSYLWLFLGILKERKDYMILAALFAFIKWTSFPYFFVFFCVYFLIVCRQKDFRKKITLFVVFLLTIEILLLFFAKISIVFLSGLIAQEMYAPAFGISLAKLFPVAVTKTVPFLLILAGYINIRYGGRVLTDLIPFFTGSMILLLTYPTIAFEYNILNVLGLLPFVIYWSRSQANDELYGNIFLYSFLFFMILGSFSLEIFRSEVNVMIFYIITSVFFISFPYLQRLRLSKKAIGLVL
jgi:hypothetical protein